MYQSKGTRVIRSAVVAAGGTKPSKMFWLSVVVLVATSLLLALVSQLAQASRVGNSDLSQQQQQQQQHSDYNNLENLISDILDDAGDRLKKSKLSSMRQIKQTLRFGRRSDPLMAPTFGERLDQQAGISDHDQRRLLALYED